MVCARVIPLVMLLAACGGGGGGAGGGGGGFGLAGTVPTDGAVDAVTDSPIAITFTRKADLATVTAQTVRLERDDGVPVPGEILTQSFNAANVRFQTFFGLDTNRRYRLTLGAAIRAEDGTALGRDVHVCFITGSPTPTVRIDQLLDLGDRLQVPRFVARSVRLFDGRFLVFGGHRSATAATDTIEVWNGAARRFDLLPARMTTPRAEHTVTVLEDGRVLVAGGVAAPGGPPLASTEYFHPASGTVEAGPDLNVARTWHAASPYRNGETAMVSGGLGPGGAPLDTIEVLDGDRWELLAEVLPVPTAQHLQFLTDFNQVYFGAGNLAQTSARFDGFQIEARSEGDTRFRTAAAQVASTQFLLVGGDTRSIVTYDFDRDASFLARDLLFERRGAHTLTGRGVDGDLFLVAGGFNIAAQGEPALRTMEIVRYTPDPVPDAVVFRVDVQLPVPFAGHVGFRLDDGSAVLAGGVGDGTSDHSRRVVLILDDGSTPSVACND